MYNCPKARYYLGAFDEVHKDGGNSTADYNYLSTVLWGCSFKLEMVDMEVRFIGDALEIDDGENLPKIVESSIQSMTPQLPLEIWKTFYFSPILFSGMNGNEENNTAAN